MKIIFSLAMLFSAALSAGTPFAPNLRGLEYVSIEINGDEKVAKKAGYPFSDIKKDLKAQLQKAGLKIVSSGSDVPKGKRALQCELMLGMVSQNDLYSYGLTFNAYEPMRIDGKVTLYVAWTQMLFGFGPQQTVKGQVKDQATALVKAFNDDFKSARKK